MSDELLTAAEVAARVEKDTGRKVRPVKVGVLARRGRIPIAARGPGRTLTFRPRPHRCNRV